MLPSTGLFKNELCPFFEDNNCKRPFCHFKHSIKSKKEDTSTLKETATYKATPIRKIIHSDDEQPSNSKKPKLEYIPLPTLPVYRASTIVKNNGAVYVPEDLTSDKSAEDTPKIYIPTKIIKSPEKTPEFSPDLSDNLKSEQDSNETQSLEPTSVEIKNDSQEPTPAPSVDIKQDQVEKSKETKKHDRSHSKSSSKDKERSSRSSSHKSSHKSSRSSSSNKTSSSHHHKSSSSSKHKSSRHSSSSSKEKESKTSSKDSKSKDIKKHDKIDKDKDKDKDSKDSKDSKNLNNSNDKESKQAVLNIFDFDESILDSPPPVSSGDEDEIMAQCRMIFDDYKPETSAVAMEEKPEKVLKSDPALEYDSTKKKRQAHEGGISRPSTSFVPKRNFVTSAMQSVYLRQEQVRLQYEKEAAEQEEKKKKLLEDIKEKNDKMLLTPLVSPSVFQRPTSNVYRGRTSIAPVSNLMALAAAKKKIDELNSSKQNDLQKTVAHTASKVAARVAHVNNTAVSGARPAPPVLEANQTKISYNIRMQLYNIMVKHCLNIYPNCEDAWDRAQTEELAVFKKCNTPNIYKSSAMLSINKLRKESIEAGNVGEDKNKTISHAVMLAGKMGQKSSWSQNNKIKIADSESSLVTIDNCNSTQAYGLVYECILNEQQLKDNGYPLAGLTRGSAIINAKKKAKPPNDDERYCRRCSKIFRLDIYEFPAVDLCNYHNKGSGFRRGFAENLYYCCQQPSGSHGCCFGNYHVTDYVDYNNLSGFVSTIDRDEDYVPSKKDMFALDCEMCYTTIGMELTRITVVDFSGKMVYDSLVKPENKIVDYNTKFSGITEESLSPISTSLRDVQAVLLSMFHSRTILIGHSLESDLKALKLIHGVVVDTSVLFPHKMGPPKKRALKTLCIENLKRIIQEDEAGHDSQEDSEVCIQLVKHYLRNRIL